MLENIPVNYTNESYLRTAKEWIGLNQLYKLRIKIVVQTNLHDRYANNLLHVAHFLTLSRFNDVHTKRETT